MSLRLPVCEFSEHFREYHAEKWICCEAYPEGVPKSKNVLSEEEECANGFKFKEETK